MKRNPFYGLSAVAMLGGCYLVSAALRLQPGQVGRLLALVGVLQLYEGLLVALGATLVAGGRAPRDGVTVLLLETLFLLDAPLLATECVTVDRWTGTGVCLVLVALALGKLAAARRLLPQVLPRTVAALLGAQAVLVFALPVAASHLASARLLTPLSLYGLWWLTLALPPAQKRMRTLPEFNGTWERFSAPAIAVWTWLPAASVVVHLVALGWIHQVGWWPAFLAPILLGFALAADREAVLRQIVLPGVAVVVSLGQAETLSLPLLADASVSPLRLALVGAGVAYALLAWRHGYRWLVGLGAAFGVTGLLGGSFAGVADAGAALVRLVGRALPKTLLGWGVAAIVAAFGLLAVGAVQSLGGGRPTLPSWPRPRRDRLGRGTVSAALLSAVLAVATTASALGTYPAGHPRQRMVLLNTAGLALAAVVLGARARSRESGAAPDPEGRKVATLALTVGVVGLLVSFGGFASPHPEVGAAETAALADIRTVISAQARYQDANGGFADANLTCLARPTECLPHYEGDEPTFLEQALTTPGERRGYSRVARPGPPPADRPPDVSATSVRSFAYLAVPTQPGYTGVRGFCGDTSAILCFTPDGSAPPLTEAGLCDLQRCQRLEW